ncbi:MAG TPA: hydrogenase maturation nickel metallochaperone HypA [bacterium]|nr:hydrogenase maturation nickel metallochaperone HypA [bacterium]
MHELGIAKDLFAKVNEKAKETGLKRITRIKIKLGEASGIEEGFLRHSFIDHILPGSIAEEATLEIEKEEVKARCLDCGKDISTQEAGLSCPHCGGNDIEIISGKNVYIENIEGE